jgi:predicted outer membrane repeat protein
MPGKRILTAALALMLAASFAAPSGARATGASEVWVAQSGPASVPGISCANPGFVGSTGTTIQAAIAAAATNAIIHICPGTYSVSTTIDFGSVPMTLSGAGVASTILDGGATLNPDGSYLSGGVGIITTNVDLTINNLTLQHGRARDGGAIWCNGGLYLTSTNFIGNSAGIGSPSNSAGRGGAIVAHHLDVLNSTFTNNRGSLNGGAIWLWAPAGPGGTIAGSTFANNSASRGGAFYGNNSTSIVVSDSIFQNNSASVSGGVFYLGGSIAEDNGSYTNNTSPGTSAIAYAADGGTLCGIAQSAPGTWGHCPSQSVTWVARGAVANSDVNGDSAGTSCADPDYIAGPADADVQIQLGARHTLAGGLLHICNGTYNFSSAVSLAKNLTVQGESRGGVTLDANGLTRFFAIAQNKQVNLSSLTMREGNATQGGALFADYGSTLTLTNTEITYCGSLSSGRYGGAIYSFGNVTIDQSQFTHNSAEDGGAFNVNGVLTLSNSQFSNNVALRYGGAANVGSAVVTSSQFTTNSSGYGGAINGVSVAVATSSFSSNTASSYGGAIYAATATVTNSSFTSNSAEFGGAVRATEVTATTSTFTSNSAAGNGGGISVNTNAVVTGSTFANNNAPYGGAISALAVTATSSGFTGNSATNGGAIYTYGATITDSTFTGNHASLGGAIRTEQGATITSSTFTNNSALETGGAISAGGVVSAIGGSFTRNSAGGSGAVAYAGGGGTVCGETQGAPGTWESCALPTTDRDGTFLPKMLLIIAGVTAVAGIGLRVRGAKRA